MTATSCNTSTAATDADAAADDSGNDNDGGNMLLMLVTTPVAYAYEDCDEPQILQMLIPTGKPSDRYHSPLMHA